jgi:hypothetical protein
MIRWYIPPTTFNVNLKYQGIQHPAASQEGETSDPTVSIISHFAKHI